jgi:hypothetical protein
MKALIYLTAVVSAFDNLPTKGKVGMGSAPKPQLERPVKELNDLYFDLFVQPMEKESDRTSLVLFSANYPDYEDKLIDI